MPNLAPIRQRIRTFLTPDIRDFIVAESKDVAYKAIPDYGTPHPDTKKYPNHVFAFPQPADEQGLMYTLLYIMKRTDQDAYNWEMQDAGVSDPKFLQVKRSYVTLRSEFVALTPAMGTAMPNVPKDRFTGTFVLADRQQRRSEDKELDTLFVVEDLTYIQKEIFTDIEPDPQSGIANQVLTTLYYRGEIVTGESTVESLFDAPTNTFWSTDALGFGRTGKQLTDNWFAVSYGKVIDLDTLWEKGSDRLRPAKFYCPQDTVTSTVITSNNTPGEPAAPTAAIGQSITIGKVGRIMRTKTVTQSGSPQVLKSLTLLPDDGYIYPETDELVPMSDVPLTRSILDSAGVAITFNNFDACNAIKNTRQAVSLEDAWVKSAEKFIPEKFIPNKATKTIEETETGVTAEPSAPTAVSKKRITVQQKGAVRKTETVEQIGNEIPLPGTDYDTSDGYTYANEQRVIPLASVPASPPTITGTGTVTTYTPVDANFAIQETRKAVSLEVVNVKSAEKFYPEKFLLEPGSHKQETTITDATGEPSQPSVGFGYSTVVEQKGKIRVTATTAQTGTLVPLKGTDYMAADGHVYPSTETRVDTSAVPVITSAIDNDGVVTSYQTIDAHNAVKSERQGISLKKEERRTKDKLAPEKFLRDASVSTEEQTEAGVSGDLPALGAVLSQTAKESTQKGAIRVTKTTTQEGELTDLKGKDFMAADGKIYPSVVSAVEATTVDDSTASIGTDGKITSYTPVDTNWAIKEVKQAVSLEKETTYSKDRTAPDSFFKDKAITKEEQLATGTAGLPVVPVAVDYKSEVVTKRGRIETRQTTLQTGSPEDKRGTTFDERTGESFLITQELVKKETVAPFGVTADGTIDEFDPLDANWSVKTQRKLVSTLSRTWTEIMNYEWPPVLLSIVFKIWIGKNNRGSVVYPIPRWKEGFTGPQAVEVNQYWQLTQPVVIPQPVLVTDGFSYRCPLYSIRIDPCLHTTQVLSCNIGTTDPEWDSQSDSEVFPATRYTDWPDSLFWRETKPYLGGFLVHEFTLLKPA